MRPKLIVSRKPRLHPCAAFVLTGWARIENHPMFKGASYNRPVLSRNHLQKLLLFEKRRIMVLQCLPGAVLVP
jgi:hypothetical protein